MLVVALVSIFVLSSSCVKVYGPDSIIDEIVWFEIPSRHELMMNGIMKHLSESSINNQVDYIQDFLINLDLQFSLDFIGMVTQIYQSGLKIFIIPEMKP